jgi:hypothetical protein
MLEIIQRRLPVRLRPEEAGQVQQKLQTRFNSLLSGIRLEYLRRLGLEHEPQAAFSLSAQSQILAGEIFLPEAGTVFYFKALKDPECLEAGVVSVQTDRDFDHFFHAVRDAVREVTGRDFQWQDNISDAMLELEDSRPVSLEVSEKELEAAREFLNPASKEILDQLSQSDSTLVGKLKLPRGVNDSSLRHLEDLDLIRKDYAVISKETGQQILKVSNRASIEESKFFSSESVNEVISCTPFCTSLMENDHWLLILVLGQLKDMGIGQHGEKLVVAQAENSPTHLVLTANRRRYLLVLTNRRLSLDDSYLISAQISACELKDIVVISTQRSPSLMRHHLASTNPKAQFFFIDGLEKLPEHLRNILTEKQRSQLREILDPLSELTPVKIQDLIMGRVSADAGAQNGETHAYSPALELELPRASDVLPGPPPEVHSFGSSLPVSSAFSAVPRTEELTTELDFAAPEPDLSETESAPEFQRPPYSVGEITPPVHHLPLDHLSGHEELDIQAPATAHSWGSPSDFPRL